VEPLLTNVLRSVSRAFYLSIQVLPRGCRDPIATGYLLARAADTIADSQSISPGERRLALQDYAELLLGANPEAHERLQRCTLHSKGLSASETSLMERLPEVVRLADELPSEDRKSVLRVVDTLIQGMSNDLRNFPPEDTGKVTALPRPAELEQHLFLAAGCVGDFWTEILTRHVPALRDWQNRADLHKISVEFGKALQLTNVLRDLAADLRDGRCYLPQNQLAECKLDPVDLLNSENCDRARPVFDHWLAQAILYYDSARRYVLSIPGSQLRLRLSVLWPCLIGLATLERLAGANWLESKRVKVSRGWVYRTVLLSLLVGRSDKLADAWLRRSIARVARTK
jgi:farnesyl-diphosphate farnesyltransferase